MTRLVFGLNAGSAAVALAAAVLWWRASRAIVGERSKSAGLSVGLQDGRTMDLVATMQEGSRLNAAAAASAAIAALLQAFGLMAGLFT